jgi:hypothetical protein
MTSLRPAPRRTATPSAPARRRGVAWSAEGPLRWTARDARGGLVGLIERVDGVFVPMTPTGELLPGCPDLATAEAAIASVPRPRPSRYDRAALVMHLVGAGGALAVLAAVADAVVRGLGA